MKNKKGFTLVEVLVTIAIIGIILLLAIPSVMSISKTIKKRELETKKEALISAAEEYAKNNLSEFRGATILKVPVRTLIYYGYVLKDSDCDETIGCIINPVTNSSMNDEIITVKRNLAITQAVWGSIDEGVYATFYWNGADSLNGAGFVEIGCSNNSNCTISTPNITRQGYNIIGWGINSNSRESVYNTQTTISLTKNKNYYAVTKKELNLTFNPNGGVFEDSTSNPKVVVCTIYNTKTSCVLNENFVVSKIGNTFTEWNTSQDGSGNGYSANQEISLLESTNLYAKWRKNRLSVVYNGNGQTSFVGGNNTNFGVDSNGNVTKNGSIHTHVGEYGEVFNSSGGLINYNGSWFKFIKTGYHGVSSNEWRIGTTTFNQDDLTINTNELANAGNCDLSNGDCTVTAYVNWTKNVVTLQYNGNNHTSFSSTTGLTVNNSTGYVMQDGKIYEQTAEYGNVFNSNYGLADYNGSTINFAKSGYRVEENKEWYVKNNNGEKTIFDDHDNSVTANSLASAAGCDLSKNNCTVTAYVNWVPSTVYVVALHSNLNLNDNTGYGNIYEKYGEGWFKDQECTQRITNIFNAVSIDLSHGALFKGFYTSRSGGTLVIKQSGDFENNNDSVKNATIFDENTIGSDGLNHLYAHWVSSIHGCACKGSGTISCKDGTPNCTCNYINGVLCVTDSIETKCCQ